MESTASKIKKFFSKKKSQAKFKTAGPGRKLNDEKAAPSSSSSSSHSKAKDVYVPIKRNDLTDEAKTARDAAIERMNVCNKRNQPLNVSLTAIRAQAMRELEEERKAAESLKKLKIGEEQEKKQVYQYAIDGVFFSCPLISEEVLPKKDWRGKIRTFLYEQMATDPGLTACLIIKNCNMLDKAEDCIETIKKYLQNIISEPTNEKFHKIRMSNRFYCDKVANVEGSIEFLKAAGFSEQDCDGDKFLVWSPIPTEILIQLHEALDECEVIQLELDRNLKVLLPSQISNTHLPPDFFRITPEEIKKEQERRIAALEDSQILKTKAMREKEQERYAKQFKYSLIRIRFPDGLYLQGTFAINEKLSNVFDFVMASLMHEAAEFSLISPDGVKFSNEDAEQTLVTLRLVPNSTLKFAYEGESKSIQEFLNEDLLMFVQSM